MNICKRVTFKWKRTSQHHKSIHLALEVKSFFGNSTPTMGSNTESSTQSLYFPLIVINGIAGRDERRDLHTAVKAKLDRLRSTRLTRYDQVIRPLDMPRLQGVKDS
jgi:hypothetical protein